MNRDPYHYLKKADYFYDIANKNNSEPESNYSESEYDYEYIKPEMIEEDYAGDDSEYMEMEPELETNSEYDYEYVIIDPPISTKTEDTCTAKIKPGYRRYFDPVTRHYYKSDKILEGSENNSIPVQTSEKYTDIWYPENKLSFKTTRDPKTGKLYRVNKNYDKNGNYSYKYNKLNHGAIKRPGTNYYQPIYQISSDK